MIKQWRNFFRKMKATVQPSVKSLTIVRANGNVIKNAQPHAIAESEELDYRTKYISKKTKFDGHYIYNK